MWFDIVREQLPVLEQCVYLNTGTLGPSPQRVTRRFVDEYRAWHNNGPGNPRHYGAMHWERLLPFRDKLAAAVGADADELALTANSTDGVNIVAWGHRWNPGDEIIIGSQEHPAVFVPWLHQQRMTGLRLRYLPFTNDPAEFLEGLDQLLTDKTRLVCISHVSSQTGQVIPAVEVVERCHRAGVDIMLDGAQAVGQIPVNLHALGCDYYTFNGHKWLLGPTGTGAVYVRRDKLESLQPSWVGGGSTLQEFTNFETGDYRFRDSAQKYEFATRNWPLYLGWEEALDLHAELGRQNIFDRRSRLAERFREGVQAIEGVQLLSPVDPQRASGLVSVQLTNMHAQEAVDRLIDKFRVITRPVPEINAVRFSCAFFNTEEEIDMGIRALAQLAKSRVHD